LEKAAKKNQVGLTKQNKAKQIQRKYRKGGSFLTIGLECHHNEVCLRIGWHGDGVLDAQRPIVWNSIGESRAWGVNLKSTPQQNKKHKN
jgi:hypothetical protein